ncbi:MAG: aminopeptidase P family N-terminal domain-containing protein, partial [Spirochaetales bacterium]|nr:aminopeptidase P family N-terminal domain-containing protein [Spirochaetales bacterium]
MQTFDKKYVDRRLEALRSRMKAKGIELSIIWEPDNEYYLSGFRAISYTRPIVLLVYPDKTSYIIPALEEDHAKINAKVDEFFVYHEKIQNSHLDFAYSQILERILKEVGTDKMLGLEMNVLPASVCDWIRS